MIAGVQKLYDYFFDKKLYSNNILLWREKKARKLGMKIGKNCRLYSLNIPTEPYLVEIGNNVIISGDVKFITHDGTYVLFKGHDNGCVYGKIEIGDNCFIGLGAIITMGTTIGDNCIVGAGSVVRGKIPSNSVLMGNPAKVVFKTEMVKKMVLNSKGIVKHTWGNEALRREKIEKHFFNKA